MAEARLLQAKEQRGSANLESIMGSLSSFAPSYIMASAKLV